MAKTTGQDWETRTLRDRLVALRDAHRLTDASWARAAQQDPYDVRRFVQGKTVSPSLGFLSSLCRALETTLAAVLAGDAVQPTRKQAELDLLARWAGMSARDHQAFEHLMELAQPRGGRKRRSGT